MLLNSRNKDLNQLSHLELLAKQVVEGFIIGLHKSPFHGFSVEFAEHRLYNPGESTKNIDWKVFARTDKMFTKKYEEETNLRCQVVIDNSSSMFFPSPPVTSGIAPEIALNKYSFSILGAASLIYLLKKQRDAFGLSLFNERLDIHTPCRSSTGHQRLLFSYLENYLANPSKNKTTSTAESLHLIAESIHRRSLVIIFSDMFDHPDKANEIFDALQHLKHNKHEVILFHTVHKDTEIDFNYSNRPYKFVDLETGEIIKLQPNEIKTFYTERMAAYKEKLKLKCMQYKIDYVEADIEKGYSSVLKTYFARRSKMNI